MLLSTNQILWNTPVLSYQQYAAAVMEADWHQNNGATTTVALVWTSEVGSLTTQRKQIK